MPCLNGSNFHEEQTSTPNVPGHETASIVICTLILSPCTIFSQKSVFLCLFEYNEYSKQKSTNDRATVTQRLEVLLCRVEVNAK